MAAKKVYYFTVTGSYVFPTDMLRYDSCYPVDETNIHIAPYGNGSEDFFHTKRSVNLKANNPPTIDRWRSFDWSVSNIEARSY